MKLTAEIEFSNINDDYHMDEFLESKIIEAVASKVAKNLEEKQSVAMAMTAEKVIRAKIEYFIDNFLEQPITINEGWNETVEYESLYDMVEQQISALYTGKINSKETCKEDPFLRKLKDHIEHQVNALLTNINNAVKRHGEKMAKEAVEANTFIKAIHKILPNP